MPGAGGTQRFVRAAGKFSAMRWLLTGDLLSASRRTNWGSCPKSCRMVRS